MDLRAKIDRGEVVLARPKLDKEGHKKWHPPVSDRPTLTLYARVGKGAGALLAGALRAGRREEGGGVGGATNVLARTASGDVQPSTW